MRKLKILHCVESYYPSIGGMQEVVKQLSERLAEAGHEVTVATSASLKRVESEHNKVQIKSFKIQGNLVRGMRGEIERYRTFVRNGKFDVVTLFAAQQWATDAILDLLPDIRAKKVFVPTGFSGLFLPQYHDYFERMSKWLQEFDMNVFLSNDYRDINFARAHSVDRIMVIPNGAGADEFLPNSNVDIRKELGISKNDTLILHVGSHTGIKGHAEAIRIFRKASIKDATLLIVANDLGGGCTRSCKLAAMLSKFYPSQKAARKTVRVVSLDRVTTVAAYKTADLFLFPSNIECSPLVLFECMASKTPFLTTDVGNAREIIEWSHSGQLLPTRIDKAGFSRADCAKSAQMLKSLVVDAKLRINMQESGFLAWSKSFTWEKIAQEYESLYLNLTGTSDRVKA